jgi:predicted dehydrogenase
MTRRHFLHASAAALTLSPLIRAAEIERIRIGQIGTVHSHAAGKMQSLRALSEIYEVVGIAEADEKRRTAAARTEAFADLPWKSEHELLDTPGLRAVAIETSIDDAPAAALRALRASKHVHLDKPGALAHAPFKALREEAERRRLTLQMGYMLRYNPAFELLFHAAREGWFGEITEIDASMGKLADAAQRDVLREYPGAGMFELACHLVDAVITLLGKPTAVHAFSKTTRAPGDAFPDNQLAILEYPKAIVSLRCNHADPFGGPHRRFAVTGTKGAMEIRPLESGQAILSLSEPHDSYMKGSQTLSLDVPPRRYEPEFRDLARVIRGEKALAWNATHDIAVHETALRAAGAWNE